jgi:outer membrane lipoprotein SlyB
MFVIAAAIALALAGCQTAEQSYASARSTCRAQGLKGAQFTRCVNATYAANRRQAQDSANAVAVGVVGGALLGAALTHHHHRSYYRPRYRYYRVRYR